MRQLQKKLYFCTMKPTINRHRLNNLDRCIHYLLQQENLQAEIPISLEGKQRLLRILMNVWHPQPLSAEFLQMQDDELHAQLRDKGGAVGVHELIEASQNRPSRLSSLHAKYLLWQGDITRLKADAIVNAANCQGLGCWQPLHHCIDNAIHSAAGLQLRQECARVLAGDEIATGGAIVTPAYNLPARYVIHTVGPVIADGHPTAGQEGQLAGCYRSCINLAHSLDCRSIAFCCIATGEFGFPAQRAAEIAVATCQDARMRVIFNVFKDSDRDIYSRLLFDAI